MAQTFELTSLESLLGTSSNAPRCILGLLCQLEDGKFALEDPLGSVELDSSHAMLVTGLFTEFCIVVAEGRMEDRIFVVDTLVRNFMYIFTYALLHSK